MSLLLRTLGEFVSLTGRVLPYFLLGAGAGAIVQTFGSRWADRLFARDKRTSLPAAVAAGALLPGCSCTTMPMVAGMQRNGGPTRGVLASFIFVSPLLSPVTVVLTWSLLGWRMTAARVVASLVGGLIFGYLIDRFEPWFEERSPDSSEHPLPIAGGTAHDDDACQAEPSGKAFDAGKSFLGILRSVSPYFLLGMAAAAALSTFVPEGAVPRFLGGSAGPAAFLLASVLGIPLYVCEGEEVPITFALLRAGLAQGPAFTFLVGSVGTCVPTILMSRKIVGTRATAFYAIWWVAFAIGTGALLQLWV